jgi:hypothetical protein
MNQELSAGERYRIEYRFGDGLLVVRRGEEVTVDFQGRRFRAALAGGTYDRIVERLRSAGFPNAPRERIPPGPICVLSAIVQGRELRTRPIAHATRAAGWVELFALLDAIAAQSSGGVAGRLDPASEPLVSGALELQLFEPSPELEEPPLGEDVIEIVAAACRDAAERKHPEISPVHLLAAFAREHGYHLARLGIDPGQVRTAAEALYGWELVETKPATTKSFELVPEVARRIAAEDGAREATLRHLLRALLEAGGADVTRLLQQHKLPQALLAGRTRDRIFETVEPSGVGCNRCGAPSTGARWCPRCGLLQAKPASFATGRALDEVTLAIEPHDWDERSAAVHRSLCSLPDQAGTPWIAFRLGDELVTEERMRELGTDLERLEQAAVANLACKPASWTPRWVQAPDGREVDLLFCTGEPQACERILDSAFLLHAKEMLGASALAGSIPQRGMLLVTRADDLAVLMSLARHYFTNAEAPPISPWGFLIQDGKIAGPITA